MYAIQLSMQISIPDAKSCGGYAGAVLAEAPHLSVLRRREQMIVYRIVYADSDSLSMTRVVKSIDWEKNGFHLVGTCTNGYELMDLVEKGYPDLVITEINMPFISGLEAARQMRANYPHVQILFYTSCTVFEYARQAVNLQVMGYVTKTESLQALTEAICRGKAMLDEQAEKVRRISMLEFSYQQNQKLLLRDLLQGASEPELVCARAKAQKLNWDDETEFLVAVLDLDHFEGAYWNEEDIHVMQYALFNIAAELLQKRKLGMAQLREKDVVLLGWNDGTGSFAGRVERTVQELLQFVSGELGFVVSAGFSQLCRGYRSIPEALAAAQLDLSRRIQECSEKHKDGSEVSDDCNPMVWKAIHYIEQSYANQDLSAKSVCERLHISASYFRTLFKRETGSTIIGYITRVRMERAQELLADRSLKTSDIAERIGYQDAHYFNYCYRKYYGISASEAREKMDT